MLKREDSKNKQSAAVEYDAAESSIMEIMKDVERLKARQMVDALTKKGYSVGVGSTAMWELIGAGKLELSDDRHLHLPKNNSASW